MKEIIRFIGENVFFTNKRNSKLRAVKVICSLSIIIFFLAGCFFSVNYIIDMHRAKAVPVFAVAQEKKVYTPTAARFTGEEHPYKLDGIQAYYESFNNGKLVIKIGNINNFKVELISVQDAKGKYVYEFDKETLLEATIGEVIYNTYTFENVDEKLYTNLDGAYINYKYDDDIVRRVSLIPYKRIDDDVHFGTDIRVQDNTDGFNFIHVEDDYVMFEGQNIIIDKPLFIPEGKRLLLSEGQDIDIINEAYIVVWSSIQAAGTQGNCINFTTSDGTGQGLYVCQSDTLSELRYVTFDGLDTPNSGIWGLTGAVTFYESDVDIDNCNFINNVCEDALNIVRSNYSVTGSTFENTFADAFDSDFCTGIMKNCIFRNTGNDAVDVSTTQMTLGETEFYDIGDKAISGGENSMLVIDDIFIQTAEIGIASKDMSLIEGDNIVISNAKIGLTMYQKKPEFGPASMDIQDIRLLGDIDLDYLIQKDSELYVDGELIVPRSAAKEDLLFEKMINGEPIR